jgi:hypothetical protein
MARAYPFSTEPTCASAPWNYQDAAAAEEYMAGQRLFAAIVYQAVIDATLCPAHRDNAAAVDSAMRFLFEDENPYFEFLDLDRRRFCVQLLARMNDLNGEDSDFGRKRKKQFQTNFSAYKQKQQRHAPWATRGATSFQRGLSI